MSTTINSIPTCAEEFEAQVKSLLAGLEGRNPKELTDEVIAKHLFDASDDKVEPRPDGSLQLLAEATFSTANKLEITKQGSANPSFNGTSTDQWLGASFGALVSIGPFDAKFAAVDGISIPYVPFLKFLIAFFYNLQELKVAVFVGKAIQDSLKFTTGEGKFTD